MPWWNYRWWWGKKEHKVEEGSETSNAQNAYYKYAENDRAMQLPWTETLRKMYIESSAKWDAHGQSNVLVENKVGFTPITSF